MRLTRKGQVTIPQKLREQYGLHPATEVTFEAAPGGILIQATAEGRRRQLKAWLRGARGKRNGRALDGGHHAPDARRGLMVLVDANVLLDVPTEDPEWCAWSEGKLLDAAETDDLAINPIIYAELAPAYRGEAELERALRGWTLQRLALPYEAAFLAGRAARFSA